MYNYRSSMKKLVDKLEGDSMPSGNNIRRSSSRLKKTKTVIKPRSGCSKCNRRKQKKSGK